MKIQNTKTTTVITAIMIGLVISPTMVFPNVNAITQKPIQGETIDNCDSIIVKKMHVLGQNVNNAQAITLANGNNEFNAKISGHKYIFNSIYTIVSNDANCNTSLETVNVVYSLSDTTPEKNIIVTENPSLTKVLAVNEQTPMRLSTQHNSNNWAGYEFSGNAQASNPVYQASSSWTQSTVSAPNPGVHTPEPNCINVLCSEAVWIGIEDSLGGSSGLAQAATIGEVNCGFVGCPTSYGAEYEFLPANAVVCQNFSVQPGDSITTTVTNEAQFGGFNTLYDIALTDHRTNLTCGPTGFSYAMPSPVYGAFILERAGSTSLAAYSANPFNFNSASVYYGGTSNNISAPYTSGWYEKKLMNNGCTYGDNVDPGIVSSSSFGETYNDSCGT